MRQHERVQVPPDFARMRTYQALLFLAEMWRYKDEWARYKYRKLYAREPEPNWLEAAAPLPGSELTHWAMRERGRFARTQERKP
jgi:hypothetical protein